MPSGQKYERHQRAVEFLTENKKVDWAGSYKEFSVKFGKNSIYKNSDLITLTKDRINSYEIKCHKEGSDWGEISWDQAERLLSNENMIIVEDSGIKNFSGKLFVEDFCYFTKNGRIHYNYLHQNKRVISHKVTIDKIKAARKLFE
jgi:hypothetical protein